MPHHRVRWRPSVGYGIKLHVWGDRACFTRPEMKVERVSYDVMTPSAARGILDAILWKPQMRWIVERIHVLRPIRFQSLRRNEVGDKASSALTERAMQTGSTAGLGLVVEEKRQQRAATLLTNVAYVIEARFELTDKAGRDDTPAKYLSMFNRRAASGQCFHRPCLGTREFPADFALLTEDAPLPASTLPAEHRDRDLGWMLHDIMGPGRVSQFFRARLTGGVLDVRACLAEGTVT
ncbi:type I-C CRISPR-associated protein Cas5c [Methylobacterium oryzihabitans]|uniref:pre-crRNA processing endonuclease n=1 Tax=Methylobacterium oryzihabitans TaxID=2499852 RepID=A0A437NVC1_9HYPH|nr:type I-C CRISPR-associated protein Cas5c [Methylobacterium oryzihabitans]RVU13948.1 type I-C CRISPR-associated protein Cas5 [Methylobacterium oryzihabitans]